MANENYDAIVVGSGISGGWAAKELTEKGLSVLLLERGKNIEHVKDYTNAQKAPWQYPHRGGRTYAMEEAYPVLKRDYPLNEKNLDWWVDEQESPYTEVKRFDWYRGYHVGGRSLLWGRQSYRWSDFDFEANARDGIAIDWPIRYAEIAPWYDYVERHAGISGSREGIAQLPDGEFQPAMPLNCGEELIAGARAKSLRRPPAHHSGSRGESHAPAPGPCALSVSQRLLARLSVRRLFQHAVLDAAGSSGHRAPHAPDVRDRDGGAVRPRPQACDGRARARRGHRADYRVQGERDLSVRVDAQQHVALDALGHRCLARRARQQLGRARSQPHGSSISVGAEGLIEEPALDAQYYYGNRPTGFYIPRYRNLFGEKRQYLRGFGYQGSASRRGWQRAVRELGIGGAFKDRMAEPGEWQIGATAFGEILPRHDNKVTIDPKRTDKWGLPVLAIDCEVGENERLMRRDMQNDMAELLEAAGVRDVEPYDRGYYPGMGIHEMGTARMGNDPKTSVLNSWNQVWDAPNVSSPTARAWCRRHA